MAGNWPWWVIESSSVVFSKWEREASSGTALLVAELVNARGVAPLLDGAEEMGSKKRIHEEGVRLFADGV